jgi:hypothetical protein
MVEGTVMSVRAYKKPIRTSVQKIILNNTIFLGVLQGHYYISQILIYANSNPLKIITNYCHYRTLQLPCRFIRLELNASKN